MRTLTVWLDDGNECLDSSKNSEFLEYIDILRLYLESWNRSDRNFLSIDIITTPTHGIGTYREHGSIPRVCLHAYDPSYAEVPDFKFWPGDRVM